MSATVHPGDNRLIDLAAHLLAPAVASDTLAHLEECPPCEDRFRSICRDAALARLRTPAARRASRWAWVAMAASLLVAALAIGWWVRSSSEGKGPAAYWFPVDSDLVALRTGTLSPDEEVFRDAVAAYRSHDPARAVALLGDRPIPEALDPVKIMLASALVKTGEPDRARALLTDLRIETLPQPDRDRASWIQCGALSGAGQRAQARTVLEELASRPGEFAGAARAELRRLGQAD